MEESERQLMRFGVRPTAMRILVHQFMVSQNSAVSLSSIEGNFEKSDRTTLYRTLKTFEEKCIVHQIDDGTGIPKYALCDHDDGMANHSDLHLHFHCTKCNRTTCLTEHRIPQINLPDKFIPEDVNMLVKGTCEHCNQ
ncbi:Fur family transcriptional regulator [Arenibacter troitsensis]|uniref:Fur family transcriptional regulator, ferric uptake regulator n=1 Tax=Arenibacter troitsensis TaxID=188872 RepID=A0A1X7JEF9_9FLAO|nr:transcriptional repressor [Arenibacter troitsensis]SMG26004.1 Fur family transcriptional regulator, ferric uptake regulator [Arenibacter troitsensis]